MSKDPAQDYELGRASAEAYVSGYLRNGADADTLKANAAEQASASRTDTREARDWAQGFADRSKALIREMEAEAG